MYQDDTFVPIIGIVILFGGFLAIQGIGWLINLCPGRPGVGQHCDHWRYFNLLEKHGPRAKTLVFQKAVNQCCHCGRFKSNWTPKQFTPGKTITYADDLSAANGAREEYPEVYA